MTWIPVSERLPEPHIGVLVAVFCPHHDPDEPYRIEKGHYHEMKTNPGEYWRTWIVADQTERDYEYGGNVTHWQPLPEPPEKEGAWSKS